MDKLQILRKSVCVEKVLLHGSPTVFNEIRPYMVKDEEKPLISATPYVEIAAPMGLLKACASGLPKYELSYKLIEGKKIQFTMCKGILDNLLNEDEITSYVYAFPSESFSRFNSIEYRTYGSQQDIRRMTITKEHIRSLFVPVKDQTQYTITLNLIPALFFS